MSLRIVLISFFAAANCLARADSTASFSINFYRPLYCAKRTLNIWPSLNYYSTAIKHGERFDSVAHFYDESVDEGNTGINSILFCRNQLQASDLVLQTQFYVNGHLRHDSDMDETVDGGDSVYNQDSRRYLYESASQEYRHRFYTPLFGKTFIQWMLRPQISFMQEKQTTKQNMINTLAFVNFDTAGYSGQLIERADYNRSFNLPIQLYFGYGSVYDVTSAAIAMNVFDRIIGKGASRNPGMAVRVGEYANRIDRLRNKRVFDTRESLIEDVAELSDSLQFKNGLKLTSHQVMEIADEWQYGQNQVRMTGLEIAVGPEVTGYMLNQDITNISGSIDEAAPRVDFNDYPWDEKVVSHVDSKLNYGNYSASLVLIANMQYARPLGRQFQYGGSLLYSFDIFSQNAPTMDSLFRSVRQVHASHLTFDNSFSWFANIRTSFTLNEQYTMTSGPAPEGFSYKFATQLSGDYFVFSKLKFSCRLVHEYLYFDDRRYGRVKPYSPIFQNFTLAASMTLDPF